MGCKWQIVNVKCNNIKVTTVCDDMSYNAHSWHVVSSVHCVKQNLHTDCKSEDTWMHLILIWGIGVTCTQKICHTEFNFLSDYKLIEFPGYHNAA